MGLAICLCRPNEANMEGGTGSGVQLHACRGQHLINPLLEHSGYAQAHVISASQFRRTLV